MIAMFTLFYNTIAACQRPVGPLLSNKCMYVCMFSTATHRTRSTAVWPSCGFFLADCRCFQVPNLSGLSLNSLRAPYRFDRFLIRIPSSCEIFMILYNFTNIWVSTISEGKVSARNRCGEKIKTPVDGV